MHNPSRPTRARRVRASSSDVELGRALAIAAFSCLDRLLATLPGDEPIPSGEIAAIVRLIRLSAGHC